MVTGVSGAMGARETRRLVAMRFVMRLAENIMGVYCVRLWQGPGGLAVRVQVTRMRLETETVWLRTRWMLVAMRRWIR